MTPDLHQIQAAYERTGEPPHGGLHYDSHAAESQFAGLGIAALHFPDPATCSHLDRTTQGECGDICLRCYRRWPAGEAR